MIEECERAIVNFAKNHADRPRLSRLAGVLYGKDRLSRSGSSRTYRQAGER